MHSRHRLADDFRALGVVSGDVLMVHASVRAVGKIAGGPDEIHLALKDALTTDGTLFMYAACPQYADEIGRGHLTAAEEAEIMDKLPAFDALTARSDRNNGALVEMLRTYPGSRVNPHVARFVAWGSKAEELFSSQPWDYAFGRDSALERFVMLDGKILLIGSDHDNTTFLHYAEHVADFPNKRVARFMVPVMENGARVWREMKEVDTSVGAHANWPDLFFAKIVDSYIIASGNSGGLIGDATSYLISARGLLEHALTTMTAVAADPRAADCLAVLPQKTHS